MSRINSSWDEEDCAYLLRQLELTAFSSVVSALRAQGVFNKFKSVVLDSLKRVLFINDELYKAEIRRAANDENLTKVATVLNPSYDTFTEWGLVSAEFDDEFEVPQPRLYEGVGTNSIASSLLSLATTHNNEIDDYRTSLEQLLNVPHIPYVPERLRRYLRGTEYLFDIDQPHVPSTSQPGMRTPIVRKRPADKETPIILKRNAGIPPVFIDTSVEARRIERLPAKKIVEKISESSALRKEIEKPQDIAKPSTSTGMRESIPTDATIMYKMRVQKGAENKFSKAVGPPSLPHPNTMTVSKLPESELTTYEKSAQIEVEALLHKIQKQMQEEASRAIETKKPKRRPRNSEPPIENMPVIPKTAPRPATHLPITNRIPHLTGPSTSSPTAAIAKRPRLTSLSELPSTSTTPKDVTLIRTSSVSNAMKPKPIPGYLPNDTHKKPRTLSQGSPVAFLTSNRMVTNSSVSSSRPPQARPLGISPSLSISSLSSSMMASSETGSHHGHDYGATATANRTIYKPLTVNQHQESFYKATTARARNPLTNPVTLASHHQTLLPVVRRVGHVMFRRDASGNIITEPSQSSSSQLGRRMIATNSPVSASPIAVERIREKIDQPRVEHPNGLHAVHPHSSDADSSVIRQLPVPIHRPHAAVPFVPIEVQKPNSSIQHEFPPETKAGEAVISNLKIPR